jgi:tRNA 2-thiouridine synthesizing protein A
MNLRDDPVDGDDSAPPIALLQDLDRLEGVGCMECRRGLCGHEVLCNVALGLKNAPRCLACLAKGLVCSTLELRERIAEYIQYRTCYRKAWDVASDREGMPRTLLPACLSRFDGPTPAQPIPRRSVKSLSEISAAAVWDAGDLGCGELVLALRGQLHELRPGVVLRVIARDPAAREDLPAWCRLTGHRLVGATHPDYFVQRKEP